MPSARKYPIWYSWPLTLNVAAGARPFCSSAKSGDLSRTLISLWDPGIPKKSVPYPQVIRGNSLENDGRAHFFAGILALPGRWTVFPIPVHAVETAQHARKASLFADRQKSFHIILVGATQVLITKYMDDGLAEAFQTLDGRSLGNPYVFVNGISWHSICQ